MVVERSGEPDISSPRCRRAEYPILSRPSVLGVLDKSSPPCGFQQDRCSSLTMHAVRRCTKNSILLELRQLDSFASQQQTCKLCPRCSVLRSIHPSPPPLDLSCSSALESTAKTRTASSLSFRVAHRGSGLHVLLPLDAGHLFEEIHAIRSMHVGPRRLVVRCSRLAASPDGGWKRSRVTITPLIDGQLCSFPQPSTHQRITPTSSCTIHSPQ